MKFDKMYKLLINEGDEMEDTKELQSDEIVTSDTDEDTAGYQDVVDEGEVEDALEIIGLNEADLTEVQKRQLAEEAVNSKIYDKVKAGRLQPEDALDILLNMVEEDEAVEEKPIKSGSQYDRDPYQKRTTIDPNEFPDISRGFKQYQGEKSFMSGSDE